MDWLIDNFLVLKYSIRTQLALAGGVIGAIVVMEYGLYAVDSYELKGPLAPVTAVIRPYFLHRYEVLAFLVFLTFLKLALRMFLNDRKRFL